MKTRLFFTTLMAAALMVSCSNDDDSSAGFSLRHFNHSGCKKALVANNDNASFEEGYAANTFNLMGDEYIEYECHDNGFVTLTHVNSVFNCATEDFECSSKLSGNDIIINENPVGDASANCICPFDLTFYVGPLHEGTYTIILKKEGQDYARAAFTFKNSTKGTTKVETVKYTL